MRPGARHALVQATLALPEGFWDRLDDDDPARALREAAEDEGEVVLGRRVPAEGRARALLDGAAVPREALAALADALLRFSGQHEHRRLVGPAAQLAALDAYAGTGAAAERLRALRRRLRAADRALAAARERREAAERERADLEALVAEVEAAGLDPVEEAALLAERERLRHAGALAEGAARAAAALSGDDAEPGAVGLVGAAAGRPGSARRRRSGARRRRPRSWPPPRARSRRPCCSLRRYLDGLDAEPGRLDALESRLEVYARLGRRYGPGAEAVLARAAEAREALDALAAGASGDAALAAERDALRAEAREVAAALAGARRAAAPELEEAVAAELAELAMARARVRVEVGADDGDPPADRVTIWLRANPGLPEAPLAETASGGELSRVLLALHGVAAGDPAAREATWVFDEVDAGIGGVTAAAVGARLAALARGRQVVVITHLPQVAALADVHYRLHKGAGAGGRATTRIEPVEGDALVAELCRMLGASEQDPGARRHAEELLARRAG